MDVTKIMSKFTNIELAILKKLHKEFTVEDLNKITVYTIHTVDPYWDVLKKYITILKHYGVMPEPNKHGGYNTDNLTELTKYAKWTVDNIAEATDPYDESVDFRKIENPEKEEMNTYVVDASESGSQSIYKSGSAEVLAWDEDDATEKAEDDFWEWGGEMEDDDYGDWYSDGIEVDHISLLSTLEERIMEKVISEGKDHNEGLRVHHNLPEDKMIKVINKAVNQEILPSKIIGGGGDEGTVEITKVIYNSIQFHDDGLHVYVTAFGVEDIFKYEHPLKGYDKMWKGVSDYDIVDDLYDVILSPYTYRYIGVDKDSEIKAYVELWLDGEETDSLTGTVDDDVTLGSPTANKKATGTLFPDDHTDHLSWSRDQDNITESKININPELMVGDEIMVIGLEHSDDNRRGRHRAIEDEPKLYIPYSVIEIRQSNFSQELYYVLQRLDGLSTGLSANIYGTVRQVETIIYQSDRWMLRPGFVIKEGLNKVVSNKLKLNEHKKNKINPELEEGDIIRVIDIDGEHGRMPERFGVYKVVKVGNAYPLMTKRNRGHDTYYDIEPIEDGEIVSRDYLHVTLYRGDTWIYADVPMANKVDRLTISEHNETKLNPELEVGDKIRVISIDRDVEGKNITYNIPSPWLIPKLYIKYAVVEKNSAGHKSKWPWMYTLIPEEKYQDYLNGDYMITGHPDKNPAKLLFPWLNKWVYAKETETINESTSKINPDLEEGDIIRVIDIDGEHANMPDRFGMYKVYGIMGLGGSQEPYYQLSGETSEVVPDTTFSTTRLTFAKYLYRGDTWIYGNIPMATKVDRKTINEQKEKLSPELMVDDEIIVVATEGIHDFGEPKLYKPYIVVEVKYKNVPGSSAISNYPYYRIEPIGMNDKERLGHILAGGGRMKPLYIFSRQSNHLGHDQWMFRPGFKRGEVWVPTPEAFNEDKDSKIIIKDKSHKYDKKDYEDFIKYATKELNIEKAFTIYVEKEPTGDYSGGTYRYKGGSEVIRVRSKGRSFMDILRSIAHELVHHKQKEDGKFKDKEVGTDIPKVGGKIEDEANATAGRLIKKYGQENKNLYEHKTKFNPELMVGDEITVINLDRLIHHQGYIHSPTLHVPYVVTGIRHPNKYQPSNAQTYYDIELIDKNHEYVDPNNVLRIYSKRLHANDTWLLRKGFLRGEHLTEDAPEEYDTPGDSEKIYAIQDIVDRVYPHIVNNLGKSIYVDETPTVEIWKDIYARVSGIPGMEGDESKSSKAQYEDHVNTIFIYYPNMVNAEDVIRALLHEYTHSLQDPDEKEENRKGGYEIDPNEVDAAAAELNWRDYLVYLKDNLGEDLETKKIDDALGDLNIDVEKELDEYCPMGKPNKCKLVDYNNLPDMITDEIIEEQFSNEMTVADAIKRDIMKVLSMRFVLEPTEDSNIKDETGQSYNIVDTENPLEVVSIEMLIQPIIDMVNSGVAGGELTPQDTNLAISGVTDWLSLAMNQTVELPN